jgi:hypothetical protein
MFFDMISFPAFLISLVIGLFIVYMVNPTPTVIYVYPTPDNINKKIMQIIVTNLLQQK